MSGLKLAELVVKKESWMLNGREQGQIGPMSVPHHLQSQGWGTDLLVPFTMTLYMCLAQDSEKLKGRIRQELEKLQPGCCASPTGESIDE